MAEVARIRVTESLDRARSLVEQTLQGEGFRFTWEDPGEGIVGIVEKGSRAKAMFLGALATHYKYQIRLYEQQEGTTVIDLDLATTGISGGAAGMVKVRKKLDALHRLLVDAFQNAGIPVTA